MISSENATSVSVVIPTLNEVENIDSLLEAILQRGGSGLDLEIIVVDDGSTDGTRERVRTWEAGHPVQLLEREQEHGLAGAVIAGAQLAKHEIVVVMDADLSHPPDKIPDLVRPIMADESDMVIGSRYVKGGRIPSWSWKRRIASRLAAALAWPLAAEARDPLAGFFAVRRQKLLEVDTLAAGFKIGLEIQSSGDGSLRVSEVPILFRDRVHGESKLGPKVILTYFRRLVALAGGSVSTSTAVRFGSVGLLGLVTDVVLFQTLLIAGLGLGTAHVTSFLVATVVNYWLNARWSFAAAAGSVGANECRRYGKFLLVCLMALFLRGAVLTLLMQSWEWPPQLAILIAIATAAVVNYGGGAFFIFPSAIPRNGSDLRWRVAAVGIVAYLLVLRLLYVGLIDLTPEEAYYWNYAQHLDMGYLDHPPMVAWIIWLGTSVFGKNEFAVRVGALVCWLLAAFFCYRLTRDLFDKSAAFRAILLLSILPFFFAVGCWMSPDAPLAACWAGALYFLGQALVRERRLAWWGVGICIGFGMLSKYTIALLVPATLLYMLLVPRSRRWFRNPEPYTAVLFALLLACPVIIWNADHDWASFLFQSKRRLASHTIFSLNELFGSILLLLTPTGAAAAVLMMLPRRKKETDTADWERRVFMATFTLVPLAVFVAFSLRHSVKLNWTGPLWLALLPAMAFGIVSIKEARTGLRVLMQKMWMPTVALTLLMYGAGFHYLTLGLPGVSYGEKALSLPLGWHDLGRKIEEIEDAVERQTGHDPLVVGMDKYNISSEMAFYRPMDERHEPHEAVLGTAGRHLFDMNSLMYKYWFPQSAQNGRTIILVSFKKADLVQRKVTERFQNLEPVHEEMITKEGAVVKRFYYRIGYKYHALSGNKHA